MVIINYKSKQKRIVKVQVLSCSGFEITLKLEGHKEYKPLHRSSVKTVVCTQQNLRLGLSCEFGIDLTPLLLLDKVTILSSMVIYCPCGRDGFFVVTGDRVECGEQIKKALVKKSPLKKCMEGFLCLIAKKTSWPQGLQMCLILLCAIRNLSSLSILGKVRWLILKCLPQLCKCQRIPRGLERIL